LLIGADFLDTIQLAMNAGKLVINASKSIPEDKEVRLHKEMCQGVLGLDSDEINNTDVTLSIEAQSRVWSTSINYRKREKLS
jgi:hypothetical protein